MRLYELRVEKDDRIQGRYKITIWRESDGRLVGTPARGVTKKQAQDLLGPIQYSFDYGLKESKAVISGMISQSDVIHVVR